MPLFIMFLWIKDQILPIYQIKVKFLGNVSEPFNVKMGVRQGDVLDNREKPSKRRKSKVDSVSEDIRTDWI